MFVRTQGFLAISAALFAGALGAACSDPDLPSDLRPDGPPEVLAVLIMDDPQGLLETATFCKTQDPNDGKGSNGDDKRPGLLDGPTGEGGGVTVQLCPEDLTMGVPPVTDAVPSAWYARIVFDELLDPSVETLLPINDAMGNPTGNTMGTLKMSNPVTLSCDGVDVPYDGYYQPAGNKLTWPVGPSLFIQADDPTTVATSAQCTMSLVAGVVKDKDGNPVPTDQLGPWTFSVAPLEMIAVVPTPGVTDPAMRDQVDPTTPIELTFNDGIDPASIDPADIELFSGTATDCSGGSAVGSNVLLFQVSTDGTDPDDPTSIEIADTSAPNPNADPTDPTMAGVGNLLVPSTTYRLEFGSGAMVSDSAGGSASLAFPLDGSGNAVTKLCFDTTDGM